MEGKTNQIVKEKDPKLFLDIYVAKSAICLKLKVSWKGKGDWEGQIPTGQKYDFWLYRNNKEIYHFAEDRSFTQAIQEIKIEKGDSLSFVECWNSLIIDKGKYTARALFCATKEEKTKKFTINGKKGAEYSPFP